MEKKNKNMLIILSVAAIVLVIGVSYAFITITLQGEKENTITGGSLTVTLDDSSSSLGNGEGDITIDNAFPVTDEVGKTQTPYTFKLSNTSAKDASYTVFLDEAAIDAEKQRIDDQYIKVYLTDQSGSSVFKDVTKVSDLGEKQERQVGDETVQSSVLYSGVLTAGSEETFVLRMFISSDADASIMGKQYATKISVDAVQVPEYAVTVINGSENVSQAVFRGGNASLTITPGTGTPSISCTNGMNGQVSGNTVTVNNVTNHTVCTVTYSGV